MLKGITISQKLYFVVGTMAVLVVVELFVLMFCIHTLSSVRAMVGAEGLWSKGQKEAVYYLQKYRLSGNENDYRNFQKYLAIPMGDHRARLELIKTKSNHDSIRQGFICGGVHRDDIDGIIQLYERFHSTHYIHQAFQIWSTGDSLLLPRLISIAERVHLEINSARPSKDKIDLLMKGIDPVNKQMTKLEDEFSYILGEGSRWLEGLILKLLFSIALCVEVTGFVLTIYLKRDITKGLNEINKVAKEISQGDYNRRATVFSNDEIGKVAMSINQMTADLLAKSSNLQQNEQRLDLVLKAAQLGIWEINFEENTVWRNLKFDEIFGYSSLQIKWTWRIFLTHVFDEDRRMVWTHFKRAREMGFYNIECRIRGADNLPRWIFIEGQAYSNVQGDIVKMAGIVMDISKTQEY